MVHQFYQLRIIIAGKGQGPVISTDETDGLPQPVSRESLQCGRQVKFRHQSEGNGISVENRLALQRPGLKSMAESMSEVQCLSDARLMRVFLHDTFLHPDTLPDHRGKLRKVRLRKVEVCQLCPHRLVCDQPMLQHLGISTADILLIQRLEPSGIKEHKAGIAEHTDFILQSTEVDTGLPAHAGIHHGEERRRNIDEVDSTFESRGGESSEVGHHSSSQVDQQRMPRRTALLQCLPHFYERLDGLAAVRRPDRNEACAFQAETVLDTFPAFHARRLIDKYKSPVVFTLRYGRRQISSEQIRYDYILSHKHSPI